MKILQRLLCVAAAGALSASAVAADPYPSQPITLVNPYAAGGPADVLGRALARELEKQLDTRFFRTGRSIILNLGYVQRVTKKDVFLSDSTVLPLPKGAYEPLNRAIIAHT